MTRTTTRGPMRRNRVVGIVACLALALTCGAVTADAQETKIGNPFALRSYPNLRYPEVVYDSVADAYLVVYSISNVPPGARFVSADGTTLGPLDSITSKPALSVGAACGVQGGSDICLVAWIEEKAVTNPPVVRGRLLRYNAGSIAYITDPFVINQNGLAKSGECEPAVSYSPTSNEFLVAWADYGAAVDVKAQRVSGTGALNGGEISLAASNLWEGKPAATYNSSLNEFLIAYWYETGTAGSSTNVAVQRVTAGTGAFPAAATTVMSSIFDDYPEVAYDPARNQYLVISYAQAPTWVIHGRLLDTNGVPLGTSTTPIVPLGGGTQLGLAYNPVAGKYFSVFQHHEYLDEYGVGISADGVATGSAFSVIASGKQAAELAVAASSTANRWLAVSTDYSTILAQFVGAGSVVLPCSVTATATVPSAGNAGTAVSFASSSTVSNCGTSTPSYAWNFGDGGTASTQNATHTYAAAGTYNWSLTVTVGTTTATRTGSITILEAGACIPTTATVQAQPAMTTPSVAAMWQSSGVTAGAGTLLTITAAGTWTRSGTSYTAAGDTGDTSTTSNAPLAGAPRMALVGRIGTSGTPFVVGTSKQFTPTESGTLYFAPNDEYYYTSNKSGSLTVSVCAGGTPCTATASATVPSAANVNAAVSFSGNCSSSGCGTATPSYAWNFGDSLTGTGQSTTHTYTATGTYNWTLTVTVGSAIATRTGTISVLASGVCVSSTASISAAPSASNPSLAAMWQGTGVTVTSGTLLTVSVADGQNWSNAGVSYTAAGNSADIVSSSTNAPLGGAPRMALIGRIGTSGAPFLVGAFYQANATAGGELYLAPNDEWYLLSDASVNAGSLTVSLCTGGSPCAATATTTVPTTAVPGNSVSFAATCSATGCGVASTSYAWTFGDGGSSTQQNPTHTYAAEGTYNWSLTIRVATASVTKNGTIVVAVPTCTSKTTTVLAQPANQTQAGMWLDSGAAVTSGDIITLSAPGSWTSNGASYTAAGNAADLTTTANAPLAGAARMALIGRIGTTGTPFVVGAANEITATTSGSLYFAPNHEWYLLWQNSGSLSVTSCVGAPVCTVSATAAVPVRAVATRAVSFHASSTLGTYCSGTASYAWTFGDGATSTSQNPTHAYAAAGSYSWSLVVSSGAGTATKSGTIAVRQAGLSADFDGDGKSDVAVYRPGTSTWFSLDSSAGNATSRQRGWGSDASGDVPVVGDFDGDGMLDPAVFRPSTGTWLILQSQYNFASAASIGWGAAADTPVPGDYDGDGKTDAAVYRASTGTWYIKPSSGAAQIAVVFGQAGDIPVAGDFDGDGKRDPAVYRPSTGTWFWLRSSANYATFGFKGWGVNVQGDVPAPGDYDGDGATDPCVFRPSTGTWFVLESHAGHTTWSYAGWGVTGDQVMPGDYDGDGKTDVAIYRPSTYTWYVKTSGGSGWSIVFGTASDVPLVPIK